MKAAASPAEAMIAVERELMRRAGTCVRVRYLPHPCSDGRLCLVCAELSDNTDVQVLCKLAWPVAVNGSDDEAAIAMQFQMPSGAVH
jgi:hypothetical protein